MAKFNETDAGLAFIATGASCETSPEIMRAIAFFARDEAEAVAIWEGTVIGTACTMLDIWEHATKNGTHESEEFCWGAAGANWFAQ